MTHTDPFFDNSFDHSKHSASNGKSFKNASDAQIAAHLKVDQYDTFQLTDAVRPAIDLKIKPCQGYRHDVYIDEETKARVPVIMAAASRETLFPLFMGLIQRLGPVVDVVLESSHQATSEQGHVDLYREHIDMPVLTSVLWDFEDLLLNDGCTGIAVLNPNTPQEIQFEEHKLLIVYGSPLEPYEFTIESHGVTENKSMKFITEAEHIHSSSDHYTQRFFELRTALGLDGSQEFDERQTGDRYGEDRYGDEGYGELI